MTRTTTFGVAVLGLNLAHSALANTWQGPTGTGGTGSWGTAANWSDGTVPNSSSTDVLIDGGKPTASNVSLDQTASVRNLTIDTGDTLTVGSNISSTLNIRGDVLLNGTVNVIAPIGSSFSTFSFTGNAAQVVGGPGTINLLTSATLSNSGSNKVTLGSGLTIDVRDSALEGYFESNAAIRFNSLVATISGSNAARPFTNNGTVTAANLEAYNFVNAGTVNVNSGTFRCSNFVNTGTFNAFGSTIASGNDLKAASGTVYVRNGLTLNGSITLDSTTNTASPSLRFDNGVTANQTVGGAGKVKLVGGTGGYTPTVYNASGTYKVTFGSGLTVEGDGALTGWFDSNAAINANQNGRTLTLQGYDATHPFTQNTATLVVSNNGTLRIDDFVVFNGNYDLRNGRLQLTYTGGAANSPAAAIRALLTTGFAGNFAGGKYYNSTAVAGVRGLGYRDDGTSVVTIAGTYYGDVDLDGGVSIADFNAFAGNFGKATGQAWANGDFDYDGGVGINDFNLLAGNFGKNAPSPADWTPLLAFAAAHGDLAGFEAVTGVPEPAGVLLLAGAAAGLRRRRVA